MNMSRCYRISENSYASFNNHTNNSDDKLLKVMPFNSYPFITFNNHGICGPVMSILVELSIRYGYSVFRGNNTSLQHIFKQLERNEIDIFMYPTTQTYVHLMKTYGKLYTIARFLGVRKGISILAAPKLEDWPTFKFLSSFDSIVWSLVLMALILISFVCSINCKHIMRNFLSTFWQFSSIILSETFPKTYYKKRLKCLSRKVIVAVWLLCCTILLSSFSAVLRNFFIKNSPTKTIDTFEQLYENTEVRILAENASYIWKFLEKYKADKSNSIWQNLYSRLESVERQYIENMSHPESKAVFDKIRSGTHVLAMDNGELEYIQLRYKNNVYHVSEYSFAERVYSFYVSPVNIAANKIINKLICQLLESGTYDHWMALAVNKIVDNSNNLWREKYIYYSLSYNRLCGVYYLFCIGIMVSLLAFMAEKLTKFFYLDQ